jgi:hypothetical protein
MMSAQDSGWHRSERWSCSYERQSLNANDREPATS